MIMTRRVLLNAFTRFGFNVGSEYSRLVRAVYFIRYRAKLHLVVKRKITIDSVTLDHFFFVFFFIYYRLKSKFLMKK